MYVPFPQENQLVFMTQQCTFQRIYFGVPVQLASWGGYKVLSIFSWEPALETLNSRDVAEAVKKKALQFSARNSDF